MKLKKIYDVLKQPYLAVELHSGDIEFLSLFGMIGELRKHLGDDKYNAIYENKVKRDGADTWHITVFNSMECKKSPALLRYAELQVDDVKFHGVGKISKEDKNTYFVVAESKVLDTLRRVESLTKNHFHVTLGFDERDLFHQPKDSSTLFIVKGNG